MRSRKTIKEIASLSGFSTATVDRVINGREGVKDDTRKKILLIAREVSYKNISVRAPGQHSGQIIRCALIVPKTDNEFINRLSETIKQRCTSEPNMIMDIFGYENLNSSSLVSILEQLDSRGVDVIGIIGVDDPQVSLILNRLSKNGVKIITLLSNISSIAPAYHIGINDNAAGRTAGLLMSKTIRHPMGTVLVFTGSTQYQGHLQREIGFRGVLRESGIPISIADSYETGENRSHTLEFAQRHFSRIGEIAGVYIIGSGAAEVIDALEKFFITSKPVVICHDMTESVMNKLFSEKVDYIIHQDLFIEANNFIKAINNIYEGHAPATGCFPVRINIVTSENIYSDEV